MRKVSIKSSQFPLHSSKEEEEKKRNSIIKIANETSPYVPNSTKLTTQLLLSRRDSISPSPAWSKIKEHSRHYHRPLARTHHREPTYLSMRTWACAPPSSRAKRCSRSQKSRIHFSRIGRSTPASKICRPGVGKKRNRPISTTRNEQFAGRIQFIAYTLPRSVLPLPPPISGQMLRGRDFLRNSRREKKRREEIRGNVRQRGTSVGGGREKRETLLAQGGRMEGEGCERTGRGRGNGTEGWNVRQLVEIAV